MLILIILCFAGVAESAADGASSHSEVSQQARSSRVVRGHDTCYHNDHHYRDIFNNAERENCNTPYSMFENLDYLRRHNHQCLDTLVRAIANLHLPECDCHQAHIHYPQQGDYNHYSRCKEHNVYRGKIMCRI
ncbi:uncharacterized protein LOC134233022 [Saccostrea cucullata]|uniref:uncharacterized protein LOC134233022 n=1 Tax=Saccostrea cuccullata TaxID=36930 RepID=UPI002ED4C40A